MALFRCASGGGGGGQITVTYDSDFYGETITCTRGQKVYSKVASSSGSVVFVVNEEGDWLIECTIGQDTYSTTASIEFTTSTELVSIPDGTTVLPTDDVETWLACAGIQDKAYTTLSQVLADSETFNALLGDSNACAYMARSTTWTTDICADQYAMSMLGQYDVCCDALLGNATWASAIVASAYADYVLTYEHGLVPVMTSATTPSGVVSSSTSNTGYEAYKVFNNDSSTKWLASSTSSNYVQYEFDTPIKVLVCKWVSELTRVTSYQLLASNDGTNFTPLINATTTSSTSGVFTVSPSTEYKYYRFIVSTSVASYNTGLISLQFFGGGKDLTNTEKIHGTYSESAYYLDNGTEVVIADPSTLSAGTYTFGSTKAKNPSDLTADYRKTIRITPNTKEIVLRPDKTLYWWGYESANLEDCTSANGWSHSAYSLGNATHNTTNITLSPSSNNLVVIGSKNAVNVSKYSVIARSSTGTSSRTMIATYPSKNLSANPTDITWYTNTSDAKVDITLGSATDCYLVTQSGFSTNAIISAMWYE